MSMDLNPPVGLDHKAAVVTVWVLHPTRAKDVFVPPHVARKLTAEQAHQAGQPLTYALRITLYEDGARSAEIVPYDTRCPHDR